jgi:beta-lactamase regulating signal transducer with metallopeptidase domain
MLPLLSSMLLCSLAVWLLFGALAALIYRMLRRPLRAIDPAQASLLLLAWLALPPLAALITCVVLYSPDVAQWLVAGHCHAGDCARHGPQAALSVIPATLLAAWTLLCIGRCLLRQWLPARRWYRQLCAVGSDRGAFVSLDAAQPAAFTLGWLNPKVFISTGMQAACPAQDIDCLLLHEHAHRLRRDNLRLLLGRLFTAPLPQCWSARALEDLALSCERACDERAAAASSRESVAGALLHVARIQQQMPPPASLAFVGHATELRVLALLDAPPTPMANERVFAAVTVTVLVILALINPLHRAIELLP